MFNLFGKELKYSGALALITVSIAIIKVALTVCYFVTGLEVFIKYDISIAAVATILGLLSIGLAIWESRIDLDKFEIELDELEMQE